MSEQQDNPQTFDADDLTGLRCPKCDYDLTGLKHNCCPECGRIFSPAILRESVLDDGRIVHTASRGLLMSSGGLLVFQTIGYVLIMSGTKPDWGVMIHLGEVFDIVILFAGFFGQSVLLFLELLVLAVAGTLRLRVLMKSAAISILLSMMGLAMWWITRSILQ